MNDLVSIIVPTYNRANSLPFIVKVLLSQSYKNLELIIVNDGSTDNTIGILEKLAQDDSRIKPINKPNGGVSSARNLGIDKASGKFIVFVDDDDNLDRNYIKDLMDVDHSIDLVIDSYSNQMDDGPIIPSHFPKLNVKGFDNILSVIFGELQKYSYCFFPYSKRFRNDIIKKYNIRFCNEITLGEDRPFVLDYIRYCHSLNVIDSHNYIVKSVINSYYRLSKGMKPANFLLRNFRDSYNFLKNYGEKYKNQLILKYADNYIVEKCVDYLLIPMAFKRHTKESEKLIRRDVPKFWESLNVANVKKRRNKMIVQLVKYIGIEATVAILRVVFKAHSK